MWEICRMFGIALIFSIFVAIRGETSRFQIRIFYQLSIYETDCFYYGSGRTPGHFPLRPNNSNNTNHITSVKAVSTVCGQGKTLSTVILQYDAAIRNKSLSTSSYSVEEGEIVKVYSNTSAQTASAGKDGPFVVIELKAETDLNATPRKSHIETAEEKTEWDRRQGGTGNQREATWMVRRIHTAISRGEMEPVIIVSPQAMPIGWYVNGNMADPKVQTGPIEDVLIRDLIPYVDSHYRTVASAKGRALEGFSMGGCGNPYYHPIPQ